MKIMTKAEKKALLDSESEVLQYLDSQEIGVLMEIATKEGGDKTGNLLFSAITKSFILGYIRGKGMQ